MESHLVILVTQLCSKYFSTPNDLDFIRRLGKQKVGSPQTILIKFVRQRKRDGIHFNTAQLNNNSPDSNTNLVWINDKVSDLT